MGLSCEPPVVACDQCHEAFVEGEFAVRCCPPPGSASAWRYLCTRCAPRAALDAPKLVLDSGNDPAEFCATLDGMDTTKPPLICPACNEAIASSEPFEVRYPVDEEGEQAGAVIAYHQGCAPAPG